jgi:hypothetical protein
MLLIVVLSLLWVLTKTTGSGVLITQSPSENIDIISADHKNHILQYTEVYWSIWPLNTINLGLVMSIPMLLSGVIRK